MIELEDEKIRWPKKLVERLVEKGGGDKESRRNRFHSSFQECNETARGSLGQPRELRVS